MLDFGGSNSEADSFSVGKRTRASTKSAKPAVEEKKEVSAKKKHKKKPFDWEFDRITVDLTDPVKIASNVDIEEFETFDETIGSDGHPKTKYEFVDGDVFAYKLPNADHEAISVFFGAQLEAYTNANGNRWRVLGRTTINLGAAIRHQADQCLVLRNRNAVAGMLTKQPVAVFEMGDSQGVAGVHAKVARWFGATTRVEIVVWIKVWPARAGGTRQMVAVHYDRAGGQFPVSAISFGTANIAAATRNTVNGWGTAMTGVGCGGAACSAAGMAAYQITLPGNLLIEGDPLGAAAVAGPNLVLDLFTAQQAVVTISADFT